MYNVTSRDSSETTKEPFINYVCSKGEGGHLAVPTIVGLISLLILQFFLLLKLPHLEFCA